MISMKIIIQVRSHTARSTVSYCLLVEPSYESSDSDEADESGKKHGYIQSAMMILYVQRL